MKQTKKVYKLKCVECGKEWETGRGHSKVCSSECRIKRNQRTSGRESRLNVPSGTVGAISELVVCADLMGKGYSVFRSLSPACFCDAIAIKEGRIIRIEIRTGYISTTGRLTYPTIKHGEIDCFGIYVPQNQEIHYLDSNYNPISL